MNKDMLFVIKNFIAKNKLKLIIALGMCGILLIAATSVFSSDDSGETRVQETIQATDWSAYKSELEQELTDVISAMDGVGACEVMITLNETNENVYAQNSSEKTEENKSEYESEYVIHSGENGDDPVLIKQYFPQVKGVAVVCTGGDDIRVKENIVNSVTALFNISSNRISVSKINEGDR